ncbi:MAG: protein-glutamate O-methyltransferase CheR [Myxococcota bacterium]
MASATAVPAMPAKVERRLREVAYEKTGIVLGPEKTSLLAARVAKRLRALGLSDYTEYLEHFDSHPEETQEFVNVITTNTTSFWREPDHFTRLVREVRARVAQQQRKFRVWCAASSTGQEPYTLALTFAPLAAELFLDVKILATDIDTQVLNKARAALYPSEVLKQVPADYRAYFERADGDSVRVVDAARRLVAFGQLNLTRPPFPMKGPLDFIFCRNVMIYLDAPARTRLVEEFERLLAPGGILMIGHSESLTGMTRKLEVVCPSVYRMPGGAR